jgi:SSS family solute:Na+ symporter
MPSYWSGTLFDYEWCLPGGEDQQGKALTLPDVYATKYWKTVKVLVSCTTITSFLMLSAGNLVGMGFLTSCVWGISQTSGIYLTAVIIWLYTASGGLFSVAYADVFQSAIG